MIKPARFPQAKPSSSSVLQMRKQPAAPPVYRPQPIPHVLQRKAAVKQPPPIGHAKPAPAAPPVYRPQPTLKVLQAKKAGITPPPHARQPGQTTTAVSSSRAHAQSKAVQPKMVAKNGLAQNRPAIQCMFTKGNKLGAGVPKNSPKVPRRPYHVDKSAEPLIDRINKTKTGKQQLEDIKLGEQKLAKIRQMPHSDLVTFSITPTGNFSGVYSPDKRYAMVKHSETSVPSEEELNSKATHLIHEGVHAWQHLKREDFMDRDLLELELEALVTQVQVGLEIVESGGKLQPRDMDMVRRYKEKGIYGLQNEMESYVIMKYGSDNLTEQAVKTIAFTFISKNASKFGQHFQSK